MWTLVLRGLVGCGLVLRLLLLLKLLLSRLLLLLDVKLQVVELVAGWGLVRLGGRG